MLGLWGTHSLTTAWYQHYDRRESRQACKPLVDLRYWRLAVLCSPIWHRWFMFEWWKVMWNIVKIMYHGAKASGTHAIPLCTHHDVQEPLVHSLYGRFEKTKARQGIVITSFLEDSSQANSNGGMRTAWPCIVSTTMCIGFQWRYSEISEWW